MKCRQSITFTDTDGTQLTQIVRFGRVFGKEHNGTRLCLKTPTASDIEQFEATMNSRGVRYTKESDNLYSCSTNEFSYVKVIAKELGLSVIYNAVGKFFLSGLKNYVDEQDAVVSSLTQRLSIIRGELWYAVTTGLPLFNKVTSKGIIDAYVAETVSKHPDVKSIVSFKSELDTTNHEYKCNFTVLTRFGETVLSL